MWVVSEYETFNKNIDRKEIQLDKLNYDFLIKATNKEIIIGIYTCIYKINNQTE